MIYTRIKELRQLNKLSQKQVSDILEIKYQVYQRYENGTREIPLHLIIKLADLYDVSLDYITGRADEKSSSDECIG